jgi:hypothetical protein
MSGKTPAVPQIMPRPLLFRKEFFRSDRHVDHVVGLKLSISGQSVHSARHLFRKSSSPPQPQLLWHVIKSPKAPPKCQWPRHATAD